MDTKSDTRRGTPAWVRVLLVITLGLSSTACAPGATGQMASAALPKPPGSLVPLSGGQTNNPASPATANRPATSPPNNGLSSVPGVVVDPTGSGLGNVGSGITNSLDAFRIGALGNVGSTMQGIPTQELDEQDRKRCARTGVSYSGLPCS